jgi:tRNA-dihydrouridine synthase
VDLSEQCDAIDLNLGCTQRIAKRGEYGLFLVDTDAKRKVFLEFLEKLTSTVKVPICAKIRCFQDDSGQPDGDLTVDFAKRLESAGVSIIEVHGRAEHRNKSSDVSVSIIKKVVDAVKIPVIANGGVTCVKDAHDLFEATGAAGVMIGQAVLKDPTIFDENGRKTRREFALEYLDIAKGFPEMNFFGPKKHMFLFFEDMFQERPELAERVKTAESIDDLVGFVLDACPE